VSPGPRPLPIWMAATAKNSAPVASSTAVSVSCAASFEYLKQTRAYHQPEMNPRMLRGGAMKGIAQGIAGRAATTLVGLVCVLVSSPQQRRRVQGERKVRRDCWATGLGRCVGARGCEGRGLLRANPRLRHAQSAGDTRLRLPMAGGAAAPASKEPWPLRPCQGAHLGTKMNLGINQ
jgi:hypothetical protein